MKQILSFIFYSILFVLGMTACRDESVVKGSSDNDSDKVSLCFTASVPGLENVSSRSVDPDGEPISMMWLFMFDEDGRYLGHVKADNLTTTSTGSTESGTNYEGSFTATVTSSVRRLHFVANYNSADINDNDHYGQTEAELMTQFTSSSGRLVYWGREIFNSKEELDAFAEGTSGRKVYLYRNQAAITWWRGCEAITNGSLEVEGMAVCNTYGKGTVAPYNTEAGPDGDPFAFTLDDTTPNFVTLCTGDDLFKNTNPDRPQLENEWGINYVFEHNNPSDDQIFVIFKLKANGESKYYKLFIQDDNGNPYLIIRNHRYYFNFKGIPSSSLGYNTFEEALAPGAIAANNVWVTIDDELPTIGDGETELSIEGETTRIYTSQQEEIIRFTYTGEGNIDDGKVSATWVSNPGVADDDLGLNFNEQTNEGFVTVNLKTIGEEPQYATLQIKAGKYTRRIKIIYLKNFSFAPVWTSSSVPQKVNEDVSIVFYIPETYPAELFPVECKISCNRFDANTNNKLDVIQESTNFTIDGQQYQHDWGYKYVYRADKPGMQRVDFHTVVSDFSTEPNIEWFLEAPYFTTIRREILTVPASDANQKILFDNKTGTLDLNVLPIKGMEFTIPFTLQGGTPSGTRVRVYVNEKAVEPMTDRGTWDGPYNDAEDAGTYWIYTATGVTNTLSFRTISSTESGYIRLAAVDIDNNQQDAHCYKSAIVTRSFDPKSYDFGFGFEDSSTKEMEIAYGEGELVNLHVELPNLSGTQVEGTFFIQTNNLESAANPNVGNLTKVDGGYEWKVQLGIGGSYNLQMRTTNIVSSETVVISETSGNIAFTPESIVFKNETLQGNLQLNGGTFPRKNPFVALEKADGTRIGSFLIENASGEYAPYSLTLYGEYKFTADEQLTVIYSPLGSTQRFVTHTTVNDLLKSPTLILELQQ